MAMSMDGFIAGPGDDVQRLFKWYFSGDTDFSVPGTDPELKKLDKLVGTWKISGEAQG